MLVINCGSLREELSRHCIIRSDLSGSGAALTDRGAVERSFICLRM